MSTSSQAVFPPVPPTAAHVAVPAVFLRRRRFGLLRACGSLDFAAVAVGSHRKHADVRGDVRGEKQIVWPKHPEILGDVYQISELMFIKLQGYQMLLANIGVQSSTC